MLALPQLKRIYLEDFKHRTESGYDLVRLLACAPEEAVDLVHGLVAKNAKIDLDLIEFIETVLVYKLPKLSREEIKIMLGLDVELKQTRFYQEIAEEERREGLLEGRQEGRLEGERLFLSKLLSKRFGPLPDWLTAKIEEASMQQLDSWGERILEAQTLSQVFE